MGLRERLVEEYGLEDNEVNEEGNRVDGKQLLQLCLANARLISNDGVPAELPHYPGLFIGSLGAAYNLSALQAAGISHIVCVSRVVRMKYPHHFTYHRIAVDDRMDANLDQHWAKAWAFIDTALSDDTAPGKVLIHCYQGISRSTTILCSYLMKTYHLSLQEAMEEIRLVRSQAAPNAGFLLQLHALQRSLPIREIR